MQVFTGSRKQIFSLLVEHPIDEYLLLFEQRTVQQKMATGCLAEEYSDMYYLKHFFLMYSNCSSNLWVNQGGLECEYLISSVSDLNNKLLVGTVRHHQ